MQQGQLPPLPPRLRRPWLACLLVILYTTYLLASTEAQLTRYGAGRRLAHRWAQSVCAVNISDTLLLLLLPTGTPAQRQNCHLAIISFITHRQLVSLTLPGITWCAHRRGVVKHSGAKEKLSFCSFTDAGPSAWNTLPVNIRTASSVESFKRLLKTHLFQISFQS